MERKEKYDSEGVLNPHLQLKYEEILELLDKNDV